MWEMTAVSTIKVLSTGSVGVGSGIVSFCGSGSGSGTGCTGFSG